MITTNGGIHSLPERWPTQPYTQSTLSTKDNREYMSASSKFQYGKLGLYLRPTTLALLFRLYIGKSVDCVSGASVKESRRTTVRFPKAADSFKRFNGSFVRGPYMMWRPFNRTSGGEGSHPHRVEAK